MRLPLPPLWIWVCSEKFIKEKNFCQKTLGFYAMSIAAVSLSPIWVQEPKHSFTHLAVENVGWPRLALMLYQLMITCTFQCVKFHQIFNVDVGISLDLKSVWDLYLKSLVFKADKYLKSNTVL